MVESGICFGFGGGGGLLLLGHGSSDKSESVQKEILGHLHIIQLGFCWRNGSGPHRQAKDGPKASSALLLNSLR